VAEDAPLYIKRECDRRVRCELVVHPPRFVPLYADDRKRAVAAFRALLVPHLRRQRVARQERHLA
jgi:hypothetical protein